MAELLFWPALFFYGEAAVGYLGEARNPGRPGWLATWGVRLGWLAQTALLAAQAERNDGFPWGTWAASLNLFVWLVVSAYLIWGCRARYRLLGLVVMPLAVVLLVTARAGGGMGVSGASRYSTLFLVLHVGLVLAAFAGFTLAAGALGAVRLAGAAAQEQPRDDPPPSRSAAGDARLARAADGRVVVATAHARHRGRSRRGSCRAAMGWTRSSWRPALRGSSGARISALRLVAGWAGRRAAYLALAGFVLVVVVRVAIPGSHFG